LRNKAAQKLDDLLTKNHMIVSITLNKNPMDFDSAVKIGDKLKYNMKVKEASKAEVLRS